MASPDKTTSPDPTASPDPTTSPDKTTSSDPTASPDPSTSPDPMTSSDSTRTTTITRPFALLNFFVPASQLFTKLKKLTMKLVAVDYSCPVVSVASSNCSSVISVAPVVVVYPTFTWVTVATSPMMVSTTTAEKPKEVSCFFLRLINCCISYLIIIFFEFLFCSY